MGMIPMVSYIANIYFKFFSLKIQKKKKKRFIHKKLFIKPFLLVEKVEKPPEKLRPKPKPKKKDPVPEKRKIKVQVVPKKVEKPHEIEQKQPEESHQIQ